ncbi:MAG: hypothetical protein ABIP42_02040 [Planctomycetota bacterium]
MAASTSTRAELASSLREENVLAADVLERLEARSNESVMPLGVILRQRGKLTMAQLIELSHMQSGNPRLRLGELAVKQGWCTEADVEEALVQQKRVHMLDLVTGEEGCDSSALMRALVRYVKLLEERVATLEPPA